jgi:hypothetical protein
MGEKLSEGSTVSGSQEVIDNIYRYYAGFSYRLFDNSSLRNAYSRGRSALANVEKHSPETSPDRNPIMEGIGKSGPSVNLYYLITDGMWLSRIVILIDFKDLVVFV